MMKVLLPSILIAIVLASRTHAKIRRDTYLSAYMESHGPGATGPGEVYGAPSADYGAPATGYNYGPPASEPHAAPENPLDPIHAKIVLVFKVLLKILIFKLIVKFIAIICVLFFLPKLSGLGLAKEEARRISDKAAGGDDSLMLTQLIADALSGETLRKVCSRQDSAACSLLRQLDTTFRVHRLFKIYMKEESGKLKKLRH